MQIVIKLMLNSCSYLHVEYYEDIHVIDDMIDDLLIL